MTVEYEAIYRYKSVGVFGLPRDNLQLGLLLPALGPLTVAQETAAKTLNAIEN
ncbi:hypothetical protein EDD21DRAFT_421582 [Dissophora ornata]|nr:hypothetical protein EDD21DRAFT_421582 [Dissophora ornata]